MLLGSNRTTSSSIANIKSLELSSLDRNSSDHFKLPIQLLVNQEIINATALIDSGATGNFVHTNFVKQHNIPQEPKPMPVPLEVADGRPISTGHITHSTSSLNVLIDQ